MTAHDQPQERPPDPRRAAFEAAVASHDLRADASRTDKPMRILGVLLMIGGVVGAFVAYNASLSMDDSRDIASNQILATAFVGLTVLGAALYVAAAVARVLRLWLLRQVLESRATTEEIVTALQQRP